MTFVIFSGQNRVSARYTVMKRKRRGKPAKRKAKGLATWRGIITLLAELCGIAYFVMALYNFLKELL